MAAASAVSALLVLLATGAAAAPTTTPSNRRQLVALIPNFAASARVEWVDLRWDPRASLLRSVRASRADLSDPAVAHALGRWRDLDLSSSPPALTCRSDEPSKLSLVCYVSVNVTPSAEGHGCCADGIEVHNRRGPPTLSRVVAFLPAVREALEADGLPKSEAETAFATHTLHVARGPGACGEEDEEPGRVGGGQLCVLLVLRYSSPSQLGGSNGDALVLLSVGPSGEARVIPTASGRLAFVNVRDVGTFETSEAATSHRVQYVKSSQAHVITDQWHVNGVLRFVDQHGRRLLAFTHRIHAEAVVLNDPWSSPGTRILQRFGTPTRYDTFGSVAGRHFFGVTSEGEGDGGLQGGVHNLWYTAHPNGRDTLTIFCNSLKPSGPSKVYEFDLLGPLATEGGNAYAQPPSDRPQAFSTPYVRANLDFQADAEGGARVLSDGVYLVSGGLLSNLTGFEVVDLHGRVYRIPYVEPRGQGKNLMGFYDPFTYLDLPPGQEPWVSSFPQFRGLDDGGSGLVSTS